MGRNTPLTVAQVIEKLQAFPPSATVFAQWEGVVVPIREDAFDLVDGGKEYGLYVEIYADQY